MAVGAFVARDPSGSHEGAHLPQPWFVLPRSLSDSSEPSDGLVRFYVPVSLCRRTL
jgi:hypothetical protein